MEMKAMTDTKNLATDMLKDPDFVHNLYDYMRVVDPIRKKVSYQAGSYPGKIVIGGNECFSLWEREQACENCISMRAFNSGDTFIKINCWGDKVFMATAVPYDAADSRYVVELLKDITHTGIMDLEGKETDEIHKIIAKRNQALVKDTLTGAYNRSFIFERLPHDIDRSNREGQPMALIFAGINGIRAINDKYGLKAGDLAAKELVKALKHYCSNSRDWYARYNEGDFILVLDNTDDKQAYLICKRLAKKMGEMNVVFDKHVIRISSDIGFYTVKEETLTPENLINKARKGLYTMEGTGSSDLKEVHENIIKSLSLTVRERETALLLLKGLTNTEIAEQLFVSISTVKKHIASIFDKAGVRSRSEFIAKYTQA
jgi:diguanylate cyclase (GGDEF)-like protein